MLLSYIKEHYGDIASVVGLVVTAFGFIVTIWNVWKTRRAAEDARRMAKEVVSRIKTQLIISDIISLLQVVREIESTSRERNWSVAIDRCDEARVRLAPLIDSNELELAERELIKTAIDDFGMIIPAIRKLREAGGEKGFPPRLEKRLHGLVIGLGRIKGRIQTETMEIKHVN